jgi:hypothetical protein
MQTEIKRKRYIDGAEVTKIIRKILKASFAGIKFSVRLSRYAGGSSIRVSYTNGPTVEAVKALIGDFEGASFDGMIDLKSYKESEYNGETVQFGNDYLFVERDYSEAVEAAAKAEIAAALGEPFDSNKSYEAFVDRETSEVRPCIGAREYGGTLMRRALSMRDLTGK